MAGSPIAAFSHIVLILSHFTQRCKCFLVMQQGEIVRIRCCLNPSGDDTAQKPWDFCSSRLNARASVGADSIRPKLMELSGAVNGVSLDAVPHNRVLAKIWGCGRLIAAPTVGVCEIGACTVHFGAPQLRADKKAPVPFLGQALEAYLFTSQTELRRRRHRYTAARCPGSDAAFWWPVRGWSKRP